MSRKAMAAPCGKQLKAFLYGEAVDKIMALSLSNFLNCQDHDSYEIQFSLVLSLFLNNLLCKELLMEAPRLKEEAVFNSYNTQHHMYHLFLKCLTLSRSSLEFHHVFVISPKLDIFYAWLLCNVR
jgi:hypothetical protein